MKKNKNISDLVEDTFNVFNSIEETAVSPFFKQKVLSRMFLKDKEKTIVVNWFTPKLQLAAIALVLLINAISLLYVFNQNNSNTLDNFAQEYSLSSTNSFLN